MPKRNKLASLSREEIVEAIVAADGILCEAAEILGVTRHAMHSHVKRFPDLRDEVDAAREAMIDKAEIGLRAALNRKEAWAIKFVLSRLGKTRGYSQKIETESTVTAKVTLIMPDDGREQAADEHDS